MTNAVVETKTTNGPDANLAAACREIGALHEQRAEERAAQRVREFAAALKADMPAAFDRAAAAAAEKLPEILLWASRPIIDAVLDGNNAHWSGAAVRVRDALAPQLDAAGLAELNNLIDSRPSRGALNALTLAAGGNGEAQAPAADSRREPADVAARVANEDEYAARQFSGGSIGACEAEVLLREVDVRGRDGEPDALRARVHALILPLDMRAFSRDVARVTAWADARSRDAGDLGIPDYLVQVHASNDATETDNPPHFKLRTDDLAEFKRRLAAVARVYTLRYAAVLEAYAAGGVMPRFGAARFELPA